MKREDNAGFQVGMRERREDKERRRKR